MTTVILPRHRTSDIELTEELECELDLLAARLKHSVTPLQIAAWLRNYKAEDREAALEILHAMEYVSENDLLDLTDRCLQDWLVKCMPPPDDVVVFHPIADFGKSGTLMTYYLKKCPSFSTITRTHSYEFLPTTEHLDYMLNHNKSNRNLHFVFYDDFMGSGGTIRKYLRRFYERLCTDKRFISLSIILPLLMKNGQMILQHTFPRLQIFNAEARSKVFASRQSPYGSQNRRLRTIAYRYGATLCDKPLGYQNSQALLALPYGCPNNTLPIIWATTAGWRPLYPRFSAHKIETARVFRKECAFLVCKARELKGKSLFASGTLPIGWKTRQFITRTDFTLFSIIRLLRQNRNMPVICQTLGISSGDYQSAIEEAKRRGILDANSTLSADGLREYNILLSRLRSFRKESVESNPIDTITEVYVPRTFEGRP